METGPGAWIRASLIATFHSIGSQILSDKDYHWNLTIHGLEESERLATLVAKHLVTPLVIAIDGDLGTGKTTWTRFLAQACGVDASDVTSPTFVLVHQYDGDPKIYHLDAYRINDDDEFYELGIEEMFEEDAVTVVEWASRVIDCLPLDRLEVTIEDEGPWERPGQGRVYRLRGRGAKASQIVQALEKGWRSQE